MRIVRSIAGIVIGFGFFYGVVRLLAGGTMFLDITVTVVAAALSGYLTALIAGAHEFPHVSAVGMLMIVASFVAMLQRGTTQPGWHEIAIAGCGPISAMIGAAIRLLTKPRQRVSADPPGMVN